MKSIILLLLKKICIFISLLTITLLPYSIKIHDIQNKYELRRSLLNHTSTKGYAFALIGDSEFCSYYVNDDNDTIWKKFESITGNKCFPGALDGVKRGDIINATKYISSIMPENSIIFIDITPTRFIASHNEINNYEHELNHLLKEQENILYYYFGYLKYMDLDYYKYTENILNNIKTDRTSSTNYNRRWDVDGDFALKRYEIFKSTEIKYEPIVSIRFIKEIIDILLKKNIHAVFVITPINKKLIFTYSYKDEACKIYSKINEIREDIKKNMDSIHASYIDIYDAVPNECFADLVHTNSCGDEIIARLLADYVEKNR